MANSRDFAAFADVEFFTTVGFRRAALYAAKWSAEHEKYDPPVFAEPTDEALAACFAGCVRPAHPSEYEFIRELIRELRDDDVAS